MTGIPNTPAQPAPAAAGVCIGQVWWVPEQYAANFIPGPKSRYCLVVAVEATASGKSVIHLLPGTRSHTAARAAFVLDAGECGLRAKTYFKFRYSGQLPETILTSYGRLKGSLTLGRVNDLDVAIKASNMVGIKRLLSS